MRRDEYHTTYWLTNPYTGEDERWELVVDFWLHEQKPALLSRSEGQHVVPEEPMHAEIISIKEKGGLPVREAIPYWSDKDYERIDDELNKYITNPFIYGKE